MRLTAHKLKGLLLFFFVLGLAHFCLKAQDTSIVLVKLQPSEFGEYFPKSLLIKEKHLGFPPGQVRKPTRNGSREFVLRDLTSPLTPYEAQVSRIDVLSQGRPTYRLTAKGYRNLGVKWIDEAVLRIEIWPGPRVQLTELFNAETGRVLYRSALGHYNRLP